MAPYGSNDWDDTDDSGLDALDFGAPPFDDDSGLDALPDHHGSQVFDYGGGFDAANDFFDHEPEEPAVNSFGAIYDEAESEETEQLPVVQAVNLPGTVTVSAYLNGSIAHVYLDPKATTLTEAQLADEICFVAGVAAKRATAVLHGDAVNMLVEHGMDVREARYFVETNMPYATPEQAGDADQALIARHLSQ
ncbi:hypothetical protein [Mycolicibacterium fortuitum]|uniref:hypothetical protein n=1 Tax=Mycolicibacterium fortuitum TaxID=1766 RepID=UPI001AEFC777|nr:hypothetical protein [Mycolicibacterium fortuitum]MBP3085812.1 hypothetical protein [Mycolicibacterium fortuitum]